VAGVARGAAERGDDAPLHPSAGLHLEEKTLSACEQDQAARAQWREEVAGIDPGRLVFVDECSTNIAMTRRRARAQRGVRAPGRVPRNWGRPTSLVASLSLDGLGEAATVEGAFDTAAFVVYVEHFLAPSLRAGQVVVMDNLSVHKAGRVREVIEARGCQLLFLPPYSPDFSPVEPCFSKVKEALRKAAARTQEALDEAIGWAIERVTSEDARGWFRHCGLLARST
jgi:transposase